MLYTPRLTESDMAGDRGSLISIDALRLRVNITEAEAPDSQIQSYLEEAVFMIEGNLGLALASATWTATYARFPISRNIPLIFPGLNSMVTSVQYVPEGGSQTQFTDHDVLVDYSESRRDIEIRPRNNWPEGKLEPWSVTVTGVRGVDAGALPADLAGAAILLVDRIHQGDLDTQPDPAVEARISRYRRIYIA